MSDTVQNPSVHFPYFLRLCDDNMTQLESRYQSAIEQIKNTEQITPQQLWQLSDQHNAAYSIALCDKDLSGFMTQLSQATIATPPKIPPKIAMLFTGQGAQRSQMGYSLYHSQPFFKEIVDVCCTHLADTCHIVLSSIMLSLIHI